MHIADGALSKEVIAAGFAVAAAGTAFGLRRLDDPAKLPLAAVLSSAFFVAALLHFPVGLTSVHLVLNGLVGILLGPAAFPAILVALALQAFFFGFGGLTSLGVNVVDMAVPALVCYYLFNPLLRRPRSNAWVFVVGMMAGVLSVALGLVLLGLALTFSDQLFAKTAVVVYLTHIPVMLIDGAITGFTLVFLKKVRPEIFELFSGRSENER